MARFSIIRILSPSIKINNKNTLSLTKLSGSSHAMFVKCIMFKKNKIHDFLKFDLILYVPATIFQL